MLGVDQPLNSCTVDKGDLSSVKDDMFCVSGLRLLEREFEIFSNREVEWSGKDEGGLSRVCLIGCGSHVMP